MRIAERSRQSIDLLEDVVKLGGMVRKLRGQYPGVIYQVMN
jgi:hypothetical protein